MRQIKEQARREQAYRLAQEEMERLEIRSDTLNDKINQLAKPTLELSAADGPKRGRHDAPSGAKAKAPALTG
jgi:hypothetical protein